MARPQKTGLDFFPLDVNMNDKVELMEADCGICGFGIYIKLLQKIFEKGYYIVWNDDKNTLLSSRVKIQNDTLEKIIISCFKRELFSEEMFNKYQILTSEGIQERYLYILKQLGRKKIKIKPEHNLVSSEETPVSSEETPVSSEETPVSTGLSTQKKRKEKKRKEIVNYKAIFDYYLTLDLIKHEEYTNSMKTSIKSFIDNTNCTIAQCKEALYKHVQVVKKFSLTDFPVKKRTFNAFFGQKVQNGKEIIGEQYINHGKYFSIDNLQMGNNKGGVNKPSNEAYNRLKAKLQKNASTN